MGIRGLQKRARRLERLHSPQSPLEIAYGGSLDAFVADTRTKIDTGKLDPIDGPILLKCILGWHNKNLWGGWRRQRNQMWEYDGR